MALTKEDLQAIGSLVGQVLDEKLAPIKADIAEIKETVNLHRDLTLEFYGKQMEYNTQTGDKVDFIDARVDIFARQTVENAVKINKIKRA